MSVVKYDRKIYNMIRCRYFDFVIKRSDIMGMTANKTVDYALENSMQTVLKMLDEAIDDYENGRVLTEEEFWEGIQEE